MVSEHSDAKSPFAVKPPSGAWRTWLSIGATGFGGPAAQIAILHREVVERHRWLDEEEFLAAMRVCMLLPGPEAHQLATYAGWRIGGLPGDSCRARSSFFPGPCSSRCWHGCTRWGSNRQS